MQVFGTVSFSPDTTGSESSVIAYYIREAVSRIVSDKDIKDSLNFNLSASVSSSIPSILW